LHNFKNCCYTGGLTVIFTTLFPINYVNVRFDFLMRWNLLPCSNFVLIDELNRYRWFIAVKLTYRWTLLSADFLSANLLIHICKIGLKGQIASQNVSFYLRILSANSVFAVQNSNTYPPQITRPTCIFNLKCYFYRFVCLRSTDDLISLIWLIWPYASKNMTYPTLENLEQLITKSGF